MGGVSVVDMEDTILCNLSDANDLIEEAKIQWIREVLESLNVSEETIEEDDVVKFRSDMEEYGIEVVTYSDGIINIYKKAWFDDGHNQGWLPVEQKNLVAQWKIPEKIKHVEDGSVYYEIQLKAWNVFERKI